MFPPDPCSPSLWEVIPTKSYDLEHQSTLLVLPDRQRCLSLSKARHLIDAKQIFSVMVILLMFLLIGCGSQTNNPLVGKWATKEACKGFTLYDASLQQIEFLNDGKNDGTFIWNGGASGIYALVDEHHYKLTVSGYSQVYGFSITGNTLTITNSTDDSCVLNQTS